MRFAHQSFFRVSITLILSLAAGALTTGFSQPTGGPGNALSRPERRPGADPVAAVGYGLLFDVNGRRIDATPEFLREAQQYYLDRLLTEASDRVRVEAQELPGRYASAVEELQIDDFTLRSLQIDWLIGRVEPRDQAQLSAKNRTLRIAHFKRLLEEAELAKLDHRFNLKPDVVDFGFEVGILKQATTAAGQAYIDECRRAGVPIPPTWGTSAWTHEGDLATNFVGSGNPAAVYSFESTQPDGICVALPRISGSNISLLGIICLGRETSNVCFWDRANTPVGAEVPITDFLGGADLGDVCSDCHAGRNPYVVHPGDAMDLGARLRSNAWYTPLVKPVWPQNPGPSILPDIVPVGANDKRCTACHKPDFAGRFPEFGLLPGYCSTVLTKAVAQTMPIGNPGDPDYAVHANALKAFCGQPPPGGMDVPGGDLPPDPEYVSPPIILGPLYACAEAIEVAGGIRHAQLTVWIDGVALPPVEVLDPDRQAVSVPALMAGQLVEARQTVNGVTSPPDSETVRDHTVDFPTGLPKPEIDPTLIYECGNVIAVRHLRGAQVTVYTNGAQPRTFSTSGDWTNFRPAVSPFMLNDTYRAEYKMCDETSPLSDPESAVGAPASTPTPKLDPQTTFQGQELVTVTDLLNGALTSISEAAVGHLLDFSTAVSWKPNIDIESRLGRPLQSSDVLIVESRLCQAGRRLTVRGASPCEELPAPRIQQPFVGQNHVIVTQAVPGARILVFDQTPKEIGDGSGTVIPLSRTLQAGDVLTVLQQVGRCTSKNGYQVTVLCTSTEQGC